MTSRVPFIIDIRQPVNKRHPLNVGLISWWKVIPHFRGGGTLRDLCRNVANDGTLTNMTVSSDWVSSAYPGSFGALDFDGVNDRVVVTDDPSFDLSAEDKVSIFALVSRQTEDSSAGTIFDNRSYGIQTSSGKYRVFHFRNDSAVFIADVNTPLASADTKFHHFGQTFDGTTTKTFVDGISRAWTTVVGSDGNGIGYGNVNHDGQIGGTSTYSNSFITGQIDDIRIYDRVLTDQDVLALYCASRTRFSPLLNWIQFPIKSAAAPPPAAGPNFLTLLGVG